MRNILFALLLLLAPPALAQSSYFPVPGTPRTVINGVEYGVWAQAMPIGTVVGLFKNNSGSWYAEGIWGPAYPIENYITDAGGVASLVANQIVPKINEILQNMEAPPVGTDTTSQINQELSKYHFNGFSFVPN